MFGNSTIVKGSQPIGKTFLLQFGKVVYRHFITDLGQMSFDQSHGVVNQNPGEFTVFLFDFATVNFRVQINSGNVECFLVCNRRMTVDSLQVNRSVWKKFVQFFLIRKFLHRPIILVPTSSVKPFHRRIFGIFRHP
ncbi:hypothetical protein SDC9_140178 [bioreactor metagenome]|uniref:Uncharacterized protein n=1 Tax=bioreactor metagenome TaxID=1076179 RepID=A0A645DXI6_9ZZZZ